MLPSLVGRIVIKRCTPSVCPSVRLLPPIFSKQESRRNFYFSEKIALDNYSISRGANLRFTSQRSRELERKCKIVFCLYLLQKCIDLRQTKIKMISGAFYTISSNTFHHRKGSVFVIFACLPVCHTPFHHSILERGRKFIFFGEVTSYASEWCQVVTNSKTKRSKVKVTRNENVKLFFTHISSSKVDRFTLNQEYTE